jgi:hypothetical protein
LENLDPGYDGVGSGNGRDNIASHALQRRESERKRGGEGRESGRGTYRYRQREKEKGVERGRGKEGRKKSGGRGVVEREERD